MSEFPIAEILEKPTNNHPKVNVKSLTAFLETLPEQSLECCLRLLDRIEQMGCIDKSRKFWENKLREKEIEKRNLSREGTETQV